MLKVEIILLTNNVIFPFQQLEREYNLDFIELNKLIATQLLAEHGLGFLINIIEYKTPKSKGNLIKQIIFDTGGANHTFLHNMDVFNYPIYDLDSIILSHWHYDHFGALYKVLERLNKKINVITHEFALFERIFRRAKDIKDKDLEGKTKEELFPLLSSSKIVNQEPLHLEKIKRFGGNVLFQKDLFEIFRMENLRILVSGEIPRKFKIEDFDNFFSLQDNIVKIDKIYDDKCLILEFNEKVVILNGCCHSGIVNTINYVNGVTNKPISHIIGGFHMANATKERIKFTLDYLAKLKIYKSSLFLFPIHCSGDKLIETINRNDIEGIKAFNASVGTIFNFYSEK
ncbi:MAG: MBL fold metallo-hydrolase [Candidatus Lokiarchaeota archaeon]|nr:MBL fold metallo-hydrolase [Candidatus Lokiarchaeota archaeon]